MSFGGADLGEVTMVYGPAADEYTRSHHALALVLGTDIFFRNGAYRPETEEGRKILAHELTHVAQSKSGRSTEEPAGRSWNGRRKQRKKGKCMTTTR